MSEQITDWPAVLVESSPDALVAHDTGGIIVIWNEAARVLTGYPADEVLGRSMDLLIPESGIEDERRLARLLAGGVDVAPFRSTLRARDGRMLEVSVVLSRLVSRAGRTFGASRLLRDVSRLEGEDSRASKAGRVRSRFLGSLSHELRTPLISIIGFSDLLYSGAVAVDSPRHQEFVGYIATSGRHLLKLIDDMLDVSKAALGTLEFAPTTVGLTVLVAQTVELLQPMIRHKRLALSWGVDPEVDALELDASHLQQVIYNFLSNAIACSQLEGRVSIRAQPHGPAHFRLEVEDDGVGIGTDLTTLLDAARPRDDLLAGEEEQGTGLGLGLARGLVEAQGGSVGVRSMPGGGAIFSCVLNRRHGTGGHGLDL